MIIYDPFKNIFYWYTFEQIYAELLYLKKLLACVI